MTVQRQDTSSGNKGPGVQGGGISVSKGAKVKGTAVPASMGDAKSGNPNPTGKRGQQG